MADRLYSAQIDHPFVYHNDLVETGGILDCLFYVSPEDEPITPPWIPADIGEVGAWLGETAAASLPGVEIKIWNFYIKVPADPDIWDTADEFPATTSLYFKRTFEVTLTDGVSIVSARASEDGRSVLTVNTGQVSAGTFADPLNDNSMEPAIVVPCRRKVSQVNVYNEFRASNPAQRNELPPDFFQVELFPGHPLVFNDGWNCNVAYDEDNQTLRFTGGVGFGKGRPPSNPWDDTDEDFDNGVLDVNGVNTGGIVELEAGSGISLDATVAGELRIIVRDQGDLLCPPG